MDDAERAFNERQSRELVAFMSLETMFPDARVRELARAAGRGDVRRIDTLVEAGVDVNAAGTRGVTPLYWARKNFRGFKRLLELGANPNVVYQDGNSVMHGATIMRDDRILDAALQHGGNPNLLTGDSAPRPPIFDAFAVDIERVDQLLRAGADINARDSYSNTPLLAAAVLGDYGIVLQLLKRGADFRLRNQHGQDLASFVTKSIGKIRVGTKWAKARDEVMAWLSNEGVEFSTQTEAQSLR